jgi:hypothetical protein
MNNFWRKFGTIIQAAEVVYMMIPVKPLELAEMAVLSWRKKIKKIG